MNIGQTLQPPPLSSLDEEARGGFMLSRERRDEASVAVDYLEGKNKRHLERRPGEDARDFARRPKLYSYITRKVVTRLSSLLYSPGPQREFSGVDADTVQFLEGVYTANRINNLMHAADQRATLTDVAGIEIHATGDPTNPIRLYLWDAGEFEPFFLDDEPLAPWAVACFSTEQDGRKVRRKCHVWAAAEYRVYHTGWIQWADAAATTGGTAFQMTEAGPNPYGVIPFAWVHNRVPVTGWWGGGLGTQLVSVNGAVDVKMCDLAQHMQLFVNPVVLAVNVSPSFRFRQKPGEPIHLPRDDASISAGDDTPPSLVPLQYQLATEQGWRDIKETLNQVFYDLDVPLNAVRDDSNGPSSGIQIVAEQEPLRAYTQQRQEPFKQWETDLARQILRVTGYYYGVPQYTAAAESIDVTLTWPPVATPTPGQEQIAVEQHDVDLGIASRIDLIQRRYGVTRDEAMEIFKRVVEDRAFEQELTATLLPQVDPMTGEPIDVQAQQEQAQGAQGDAEGQAQGQA